MKGFAIAVVMAACATAPALAQVAPQIQNGSPVQFAHLHTPAGSEHKPLYVCWFGDDGRLTGYTPAEPNNHPPEYLLLTGRGGDQAFSYTIRSDDGRECPARLPQALQQAIPHL